MLIGGSLQINQRFDCQDDELNDLLYDKEATDALREIMRCPHEARQFFRSLYDDPALIPGYINDIGSENLQ